ncbi:class I SAM-dependent methyltransferase [Streptomyces sp. NPDC051976]|uniref:class I SAM-dependent methyltransferase n=1 Tax=Streptomyces sp. NPDC051976 TaxID=3154947 RepID=UPI00343368A6
MRFDPTGKVTLDHLYTQPDPRTYFGELRQLEYCVPQQAKPYFEKLIKEYRESQHIEVPTVVDVGCSYGINGALLKCDATMDELYDHYARPGVPRADLLALDREFTRSRRPAQTIRCVGLDISDSALSYGLAAGFLDDAVHADLERHEPTARQAAQLAGADLVISTGCLGYVTEATLTRVVQAQGGRRPWMAHTVLRMFPFDKVERALDALGYRTERVEGEFRQRRFASPKEQALVLDTMSADGVDTRGLEAEGWLYAQLYLSRPSGQEPTAGSHDPNREQK